MGRTLETPKRGLGFLVTLWLAAASAIVIIDALFVLGRPHTLESPDMPWPLWQRYARIDRRYASMSDSFVVVQSYFNLLEVALQILAVLLNAAGKASAAHKTALVVSVMTFYKTLMYVALEHDSGYEFMKGNTTEDLVLLVALPTSFWFVMPAVTVAGALRSLTLGSDVVYESSRGSKAKIH